MSSGLMGVPLIVAHVLPADDAEKLCSEREGEGGRGVRRGGRGRGEGGGGRREER